MDWYFKCKTSEAMDDESDYNVERASLTPQAKQNVDISIMSVREVADYIGFIKKNNYNVVSIRDTRGVGDNQKYYDLIDNAGLKNLLVVSFDDLHKIEHKDHGQLPEESHIRSILDWFRVKRTENNNPWIVHCSAGISRSSAVAILLSYINNTNKYLDVIDPSRHWPNEMVLDIGGKLLGKTDIKDETRKKMEEYNPEGLVFPTSIDSIFENPK